MYVAGRAAQVALKLGMDVSTLKDIFKSNLDAEILKNKNSKLGSGSSNLKQVYFDTVVLTPLQLDALVKSFGVDHIIGGHRLSVRHDGIRSNRPYRLGRERR